jgi:uncharacterized protein YerC
MPAADDIQYQPSHHSSCLSDESDASDESNCSNDDSQSNDDYGYLDVYPLDEECPLQHTLGSDINEDSETDTDATSDHEEAESTNIPSEPSRTRSIIPLDRDSGELNPLNLAFASWSWTHGISIEAYNSLQQLLHSDIVVPLDSLLHSLHGVRKHVLNFLQLSPIHTLPIRLKVAKLVTQTRKSRSINSRIEASVATYSKSTLYYHKVSDILMRVIANPTVFKELWLHQYTTLYQPQSAPWLGFLWRSSYTLSKGIDPPMIGNNILYPGCFVTVSQRVFLNNRNKSKVKSFDVRALWSDAQIQRFARISSVTRSPEGVLECEVDPLLKYHELPLELQIASRRNRTVDNAIQLFMADFEWDKPVVVFDDITTITNGEIPWRTLLMGD